MDCRVVAIAAAWVTMALSLPALAQERDVFDSQRFRPAVGPNAIFSVEQAAPLEHLRPSFNLFLNYASEPLITRRGEVTTPVVDQQLAMQLMAGIGLFDVVQFDVLFPLYLVNDVTFRDQSFEGIAVGDLRTRVKGRFWSVAGFSLGAGIDVGFPTGNGEAFVGNGTISVSPRILTDYVWRDFKVALNLGAIFQEGRELAELNVGSELTYGLGASYSFLDGFVALGGELLGTTLLSSPFSEEKNNPLEGILGAKVDTGTGVVVNVAGGGGFIGGAGTPLFRGLIGVAYTYTELPDEPPPATTPPPVVDTDRDGIHDKDDKCPTEPEDEDDFEDDDGCPDPDNDKDGIADKDDKCPVEAGAPRKQGCPDPDPDDDTIEGDADKCPNEAEDFDTFEDEDGCPDPDNDNDGIADAKDKCPEQPGLEEDQGCPPKKQVAVREEKEIKILEKVFFEKDKAVIQEESFALLKQVGLILRSNPDIELIEIGGHTDNRGKAKYNKELSQARADAVKIFLTERSKIDPVRLKAVGYGSEQLLDKGKSRRALARNRRVEFKILKTAPKPGPEPPAEPETPPSKPAGEESTATPPPPASTGQPAPGPAGGSNTPETPKP